MSEYGTVAERVARGIECGRSRGFYLSDLNAIRFDIGDGDRCALGQWFGSYEAGIRAILGLETYACQTGYQEDAWAIEHGFFWDLLRPMGKEELQAEWLTRICDAQGIDLATLPAADAFDTDECGDDCPCRDDDD
jgi:hypothetical protein